MKVTRDGRCFTVDVVSDGEGLVSYAGSALLARVADKTGLTGALSLELAGLKQRRSGHDQGRVIRDLAVMLGDGGDCLADLGALGDQEALFGGVASASTAFRLVDRIARGRDGLERLRGAHAKARARVWKLTGAPERLTIDLDATLIGSHSEKEGAAGNFKGGYGFHPMLAYADETSEALAGELRPGNAGANTAADQIAVAEQAIGQIPTEYIENIKLLLRVDTAGAGHELLDWAREGRIEFSVGYELNEAVRTAILQTPDSDWVSALDQDGSPRPNGQVCEITSHLDLAGWPERSRVIVRRERAHPGAQLTFTDHDGHRFQAILTDQPGDIARVERDHRGRARVEVTSATTRTPACATSLSATSSTTASGSRSCASPTTSSCGPSAYYLPVNSRNQSPSACATGCCTSPGASPSTPAPPRFEYRQPGPGQVTSPSRLPASERSPHPQADTATGPHDNPAGLRRYAPAKPAHKPALDRHKRPGIAPRHPRPPPATAPTGPTPHQPAKHSHHTTSCTIRASPAFFVTNTARVRSSACGV